MRFAGSAYEFQVFCSAQFISPMPVMLDERLIPAMMVSLRQFIVEQAHFIGYKI